jgi:hypothetical protein
VVGPLFFIQTLLVNFLAIHNHIFGSDDTDSHLSAINCDDLDADVVADNDFLPDFSC